MTFRSRKLLAAARDQPCVLCNARDSTTIAAHSNRVEHGHGTGCKAHDFYTAWVCQRCHDLIDGRAGKLTKEEKQEMWNRAFQRTVALWFQQGIVKVTG